MTSYLRYKAEMAVLDKDENIESWITVRGNHIPIKKGQSKEEAVKSFLENKNESKGKVQEKSKYEVLSAPSLKGFVISKNEKGVIARGNGKPLAFEDIDRARDYIKTLKKEERKEESKYDPDFEVVRKNALANGNVYGGRYTQKSKAEAYKEYKNDKMFSSFSKHYDDLYNNNDKNAQHGDLVKEFDKRLQSDPEFKKEVQEFVRQRGDVLSSDREVKAYMLARNEVKEEHKDEKKTKAPKVTRVDEKKWNSPASDPWRSLYDKADKK